MSVNIKLGDNVVTNVETISLEDADNLGQRIQFGLKGEGYTVKFISEGKAYATYTAAKGQSILAPPDPKVEGKNFGGWFSMETGGEAVSFPVSPTADVTYYAQYRSVTVIGFKGLTNGTNPTPDLVYTDDIAGLGKFTKIENGIVTNVINVLDGYFPYNKISEFTDNYGNVLVKFPKLWMKWVRTSAGVIDGVKFSDVKIDDDFFIPDAFLDPKDASCNTYLDYFALGKYEGSVNASGEMCSMSKKKCRANLTRNDARTAARRYGLASNYYYGFQQMDISMMIVYNFLCMLYYKTCNIQRVYEGRTTGFYVLQDTGSCDNLDGMNGWNSNTRCVKMLGVENPYGNGHKWIDGIVFNNDDISIDRLPQNFKDSFTEACGMKRQTVSGPFEALSNGQFDYKSYCYPSPSPEGNYDTYYGDSTYYNNGLMILSAGGAYNSGQTAGLWCTRGYDNTTTKSEYITCRLAYRPVNE